MTTDTLLGHEWEDYSRHGSPMWGCKHCDVWKDDVEDPDEECPKIRSALERRAAQRLHELKRDYRDMKIREKYEGFLRRMFGDD